MVKIIEWVGVEEVCSANVGGDVEKWMVSTM